ncbi:MAG: restriction endonuclease subunit S [Succinatimonas sp.]|nr:restriction endonuclease subunit S [Succinatimonas sp.]MDD6755238.1 restriction endonuclease subunit S [Succinatimonas sp.]
MEYKLGEMIACNPTVKLEKGEKYNLVDIDSIQVGTRYVKGKELQTFEGKSGCRFQNGDTVMARITPCLENGKIAQIQCESEKGFGSTELLVFRGIKDKTDSDYVFSLMSTEYIRNLSANSMSGASGRQRADLSFIKNIKWDFPSLSVQQRIASILNNYDKLIQNYQKQIEDLQNLAGELYKEWFVRFRFPGHEKASFENGIPAGWKVDKIKNRVKRLSFGKTYKKDEVLTDGEIIVIDQSESEYLGYHNGEPSHKATIDEPIALFGDHSCKYELMTRDFSLGENVIPFVSQNIDVYYLYYAVYKIVETEEYKRHWSLFINKKILIPEEKLQLMFRKYALSIKKQTEILSFQITNLSKQRALLLPRLMSGKLEVK